MLFFLCIMLLATVTAVLPLIVPHAKWLFPSFKAHPAQSWLPVTAGVLLVVSTLIPNIHISSQTTTFQQHFVGGGTYSACLYLYVKQLLGWRLRWAQDWIVLYAWVSALGVANKLLEFALLELKLANIYTGDAYWDLLANTLGGFAGYGLLVMVVHRITPSSPKLKYMKHDNN